MDRESRSNKYKQNSVLAQKKQEENELRNSIIPINEALLDAFCRYSLSRNARIHKHGLTSLYLLINKLPPDIYKDNQLAKKKLQFLKQVLQDRTNGIYDVDLILSNPRFEADTKILISDSNLIKELTDVEITLIEQRVTEYLNMSGLFSNLRDLKDAIIRFEQASIANRLDILNDVRKFNTELTAQFRRNDILRDSADTIFRLSDMASNVSDIYKQVTSPSFKLKTGMQGLNMMLGGGLEQGNVYCFFGLPGEGKTITIENLLYQVWKYNRGYECRDKTKRPCILLLTMENFVRQTVCALYNIITHKDLKDCDSAEEAIQKFREHAFEFRTEDNNAIEIVIKFKPVNSVTTDYLNKMIEDLADEGYEVIAVFQDYLKRILPVLRTNDPYQDLGNVTNEFKTIATLNKLPLITVSQLNRDAAKLIDEGRNANKADLIKKLGRSNIGESSRIDENLDGTFIITPEVSQDGKRYMGIKMTKHRYPVAKGTPSSLYQPFCQDTNIALEEDLYLTKPAYRESLVRDAEEIRMAFSNLEREGINRVIKQQEQINSSINDMMSPGITKPIRKEKEYGYTPPTRTVLEFIDERDYDKMRAFYNIPNYQIPINPHRYSR